MRTFVALTPGADVRAAIRRATAPLRDSFGNTVAWVDEPEFHVTLKFLGDRSADEVNRLVAVLRRDIPTSLALRLVLAGLGAFPSIRRPRVIWLGLESNHALAALYQQVEGAAT